MRNVLWVDKYHLFSTRDVLENRVDQSQDLIFMCEPGGLTNFVNSTMWAKAGIEPCTDTRRFWDLAMHPGDLPIREHICRTGIVRSLALVFRMLQADGCYRWVSLARVPIYGLSGRCVGHVGAIIDIDAGAAFRHHPIYAGLVSKLLSKPARTSGTTRAACGYGR